MVKVFVYASYGISMEVLEKSFSQVEGNDMSIVVLHRSLEDSMIEAFAKKRKIPCYVFPKGETFLEYMELVDYCDGFVLIGNDPLLEWFVKVVKLSRKTLAWFDKKGKLYE